MSLTKVSLVQRIRREHEPAAEREADDQEQRRAEHALRRATPGSTLPWSARPKVIAMIIQPIVSSMIAEATITCPTLRRMKPISRTTMATIFTEEIDSAVPRNSDVIRRSSGRGSMASGRNSPSAKPQANGTAMPVTETLNAARPRLPDQARGRSPCR